MSNQTTLTNQESLNREDEVYTEALAVFNNLSEEQRKAVHILLQYAYNTGEEDTILRSSSLP